MNNTDRAGGGRPVQAAEPTLRPAGATRAAGLRHLRSLLVAFPIVLLAACGGGGSDGAGDAPVARVEILSANAWLAGPGQTRELAAQAFDVDGHPVEATITWASSRPGTVAVDAHGRLSTLVASGSAQITAMAGSVGSAPILAFVAAPAPGVIVIDDAAIVGDPAETDPDATASLANTYQVALQGAAPAVGSLLLGSGDKALAGRVTATTSMGTQTLATLQRVPIAELFATLEIDEEFDLSRAEAVFPPEVTDFFAVARSGNTWTFTPKATARSQRKRPTAVTGTQARDLLPFRSCEVGLAEFDGIGDLPIGLEPPTFSVTLSPTLETRYSRATGLTRFVLSAEPQVTMGATLKASAPIKGEIKCTLQLLALRLPIGGPLAFFIGGLVPVGVGFELEAEATLATFRIGAQSEAGTRLAVGWSCVGGACEFVRSLDEPTARISPVFDGPAVNEDLRVDAGLSLFAYVEAELGNPFLRSLRFKGFEARIGGKLEGNFAPPAAQMLDAGYASDYGAQVEGQAQVGTGIDGIVTLLGLGSLTSIELGFVQPLASSPKALSIHSERTNFALGDTVEVRVTLDPATVDFPSGHYNVDSVQLRRRVGAFTEVLASLAAIPGQQVFDFSVVATHGGDVSQWTAFVTTRRLPFEVASLELGPVGSGAGLVLVDSTSGSATMCEASVNNAGTDSGDYEYVDIFDAVPSPTCSAAAGTARASVSVTPVVAGPSRAIGSALPASGTLSFEASIEIRPTVSTGNPDDQAAAFGQGSSGTSWTFRVGAETRLRATLSYTSAGGADAGGGVSVRGADGTLLANIPPGVHEIVLQPGSLLSVSVGGSGLAGDYINRRVSPLPPTFATAATQIVLEFNP